MPDDRTHAERPLRPGRNIAFLLIAVLCVVLLVGVMLQRRAIDSARHRLDARHTALSQMFGDAHRLQALSNTPRLAIERQRPNEALLAQVEIALANTGIPLDRWQDSVPQPARELANAPYTLHRTQLFFERLSSAELARFAHGLTTADPTLSIPMVHLVVPTNAVAGSTNVWNVDLSLEYAVFVPSAQSD